MMNGDVKEHTEIVPGEKGLLVARCISGHLIVEMPLPKGIETWPDDERDAHLRRFVAPRLKVLMQKAKAGEPLPRHAEGVVSGYQVTVPATEGQCKAIEGTLTPADSAKIARAEAKRARRALRLVKEESN